MNRRLSRLGLLLVLAASAPAPAPTGPAAESAVGSSFQIPYRRADTNHFLVRVRVNGKGPFNFVVDTGAPALYITTATAGKIGLKTSPDEVWTAVDSLDFEGGARLTKLKAQVDDPFQLLEMNRHGLPGTSIDGILGFTVLARFRLEIDPSTDRMTWTRSDFMPPDPPFAKRKARQRPANEVQVMKLVGPGTKGAALLPDRRTEIQFHPRGFCGLELEELPGKVRVSRVLDDSPAARAGIEPGDVIVRLFDREIKTGREARSAVAKLLPGGRVSVRVERGTAGMNLVIIAGEGF